MIVQFSSFLHHKLFEIHILKSLDVIFNFKDKLKKGHTNKLFIDYLRVVLFKISNMFY